MTTPPVAPWTRPASGLPVDEQPYARFARGPLWYPGRAIGALVLGVVAFLATILLGELVGLLIDARGGPIDISVTGPGLFIGNNLGIACWILLAIWIASGFFIQPKGYLSSVVGRFRWGWFGLSVAVILPLWLVFVGGSNLLAWQAGQLPLSISHDTWVLLAGVVLTTPLQCAGEEFAFRGLINRSVASLVRNRRVGLMLGALVSSLLFMLAHSAGDPWLNTAYVYFGLASCWLCWRTGGLEASLALHLVNNMTALATAPFIGVGTLFDRGDGTSSLGAALLQVGVISVGVGLIEVVRRRRRPVREAAPGRALLPPPVWYPTPAWAPAQQPQPPQVASWPVPSWPAPAASWPAPTPVPVSTPSWPPPSGPAPAPSWPAPSWPPNPELPQIGAQDPSKTVIDHPLKP